MPECIQFREANVGDPQNISHLVLRVFNKFVAPGFSLSGREMFEDFVQPGAKGGEGIIGWSDYSGHSRFSNILVHER